MTSKANDAQPDAAVIIVSHNSAAPLVSCLDALDDLPERGRLEVCIVDSGSSAEQRERIRRDIAPRVDHMIERPNLGFGRGCNAGVAVTRAPILIFVNPDTRVLALPPRALSQAALGRTVIGAVNHVFGSGNVIPLGLDHFPTASSEARQMLLGRFSDAFHFTAERPAWVAAAAMALLRTEFDALGGFTDALFLYYEDADLCAQHRERGGAVEVDPTFVVVHEMGTSTPSRDEGLDAIGRLSARIFVARHAGRAHAKLLYAILVLFYVPRRVTMIVVRGSARPAAWRRAGRLALDLVWPSRVLRRLAASDAAGRSH
jgi:N-acetylglucosaminyl-diphospho-decaprenol L-rhamnosyltransferase